MYIYVEIIEEFDVIDLNFIYLRKMYFINIGNDKELEEVNFVFLYKLYCIYEIFYQVYELYSIEEVFGEILNILEDVWKVLEEKR